MCKNCFNELIYKFDSEQSFNYFSATTKEKVKSENIEVIDYRGDNQTDLPTAQFIYHCLNCNERWALSIPENAWRGYFLPEQKAIEHMNQIREAEKKKGRGCVVIGIFIVLLIIYYLFK